MIDNSSVNSTGLERRIGLRSAVLFNMLEMIGVGPFITLPLVIAAAGFKLSGWAWVLGAAALRNLCNEPSTRVASVLSQKFVTKKLLSS